MVIDTNLLGSSISLPRHSSRKLAATLRGGHRGWNDDYRWVSRGSDSCHSLGRPECRRTSCRFSRWSHSNTHTYRSGGRSHYRYRDSVATTVQRGVFRRDSACSRLTIRLGVRSNRWLGGDYCYYSMDSDLVVTTLPPISDVYVCDRTGTGVRRAVPTGTHRAPAEQSRTRR